MGVLKAHAGASSVLLQLLCYIYSSYIVALPMYGLVFPRVIILHHAGRPYAHRIHHSLYNMIYLYTPIPCSQSFIGCVNNNKAEYDARCQIPFAPRPQLHDDEKQLLYLHNCWMVIDAAQRCIYSEMTVIHPTDDRLKRSSESPLSEYAAH